MLRPCIRITDEASYHTDLTDYISRLGQIHEEQPELHMGRYQELTLTNRQSSFARHGDHSCVITAVNNDENPASMTFRFQSTLPLRKIFWITPRFRSRMDGYTSRFRLVGGPS